MKLQIANCLMSNDGKSNQPPASLPLNKWKETVKTKTPYNCARAKLHFFIICLSSCFFFCIRRSKRCIFRHSASTNEAGRDGTGRESEIESLLCVVYWQQRRLSPRKPCRRE
jgi:hypothetical protein